ncbi:hypothetical protein BKA70DRAFT_1571936 [Coprinopsis sp. MPI-PUGE-AT-0042]|nr:hypothetical protein BKA70DRAFT_1571936 [Coprinopsis sp. MPI-PUGE-AT-0042]
MSRNWDLRDTSQQLTSSPLAPRTPPCIQVIKNRELMHIIFAMLQTSLEGPQVQGPRRERHWRHELHRILCVNKSLFETTVEFLWETLNSFLPAFRLLPSFKADDTGFTFDGICEAEWDRFEFYACQVRRFSFDFACPFEQLPEPWLLFLLHRSASKPLFPALKAVTCSYSARGAVRLLPVVLKPQVESLSLCIRSRPGEDLAIPPDWESKEGDPIDAEPSSALFASAPFVIPGLKHLYYQGPITMGIVATLSDLSQLAHLSLTISSWNDVRDIRSLNDLSVLQTLKLVILPTWGPNEAGTAIPSPPPNSLPNLRHLDVISTVWVMFCLTYCISVENLKFFRHQSTRVDYAPHPLIVAQQIGFISKNPHLNRLIMTASARNVGKRRWPEEAQENYLTFLANKIKDGRLVELKSTGIPLSGVRIRQVYHNALARSNSVLESFRFEMPRRLAFEGDQEHFATPDTLQDLSLRGCTTLKHLQLQFRDDAFDQEPPFPTQEGSHALEQLHILTDVADLNYPLSHKVAIAMFLDRLFPFLDEVSGSSQTLWSDVNVLVKSYQKGRRVAQVATIR